jgi:hypothetical protein
MKHSSLLDDLLLLNVSFDIHQLSPFLCWQVIDESQGGRNLMRQVGRHAGSVHLEKDDRVHVCVTAFSGAEGDNPPEDFGSFQIESCTLQSVPRLRERDTFYSPSPFQTGQSVDGGTAIPIGPFSFVDHGLDKGLNAFYERRVSDGSVLVDKEMGIWEISLVLVVEIQPKATAVGSHKRVFRFDPEAEVGTGTSKNL